MADHLGQIFAWAFLVAVIALLLWLALTPLERPRRAERDDAMARPFGDWPHIDPRI